MSALRAQVFGGFRRLMRLRHKVFAGDTYAIDQARLELRKQFFLHKDVTDPLEIGTYVVTEMSCYTPLVLDPMKGTRIYQCSLWL